MKLRALQQAVVRAQDGVETAKLTLLDAQQRARTAKGRLQQVKLEHKRARKASKNAKQVAWDAQEYLQHQAKLLLKAEDRLAQGLKVLQTNGNHPHRSPQPSHAKKIPVAHHHHLVSSAVARTAPRSARPAASQARDLPLPIPILGATERDGELPATD